MPLTECLSPLPGMRRRLFCCLRLSIYTIDRYCHQTISRYDCDAEIVNTIHNNQCLIIPAFEYID